MRTVTEIRRLFPCESIVEIVCRQGDRQIAADSIPTNEQVREELLERRRREERLANTNRILEVLNKCNEALVHAADERRLLKEVCSIIVETGKYRFAWGGFKVDDAVASLSFAGHEDGYLKACGVRLKTAVRGYGTFGTAMRTGMLYVADSIRTDPIIGPWREEALRRGYLSSIAIPLLSWKEVIGVLEIFADKPHAFLADEVKLFEELGDDLSYGIVAIRTR